MAWFFFALSTAIFWGVGYSLTEKLLHNGVSSSFFLALLYSISAPVFIAMTLWSSSFKTSLNAMMDNNMLWMAMGAIIAYMLGNLFIMQAIYLKNASYANLIEITYPLFTILFTYLFFKNFHLDGVTLAGGLLILSGAALIIYRGA